MCISVKEVVEIGLEAEVLLLNKKGDIVFPGDFGLPIDDFELLGEIRAEKGDSVAQTLANFYRAFYKFKKRAKRHGLTMYDKSETVIPYKLYKTTLKRVGVKELPTCSNINKKDIMEYSNLKMDGDKIVGSVVSCGLHVHFSKALEITCDIPEKRGSRKEVARRIYRLPKMVSKTIIRSMDKKLFNDYADKLTSKYRKKGFYELKHYGFEYRSLPFSPDMVMGDLERIVEVAYSIFNSALKGL